MKRTAVLVVSDGVNTEQWLGPIESLTSSATDYRRADFPLLPNIRVFNARAIGFTMYRTWQSYTRGELYEELFFYKPRLLSELVRNFNRFDDTLTQSTEWRPLRPYDEHERLDRTRLEELIKASPVLI